MRRISNWIAAGAALLLSGGLAGCGFEHSAGVDYDRMVVSGRTGDGRSYEVKGAVHAESWTPAFLYVFPLLPGQSAERAKELALQRARELGADAVTDVRLHVETHMPFFWVAGWIENHVSATAVKYN